MTGDDAARLLAWWKDLGRNGTRVAAHVYFRFLEVMGQRPHVFVSLHLHNIIKDFVENPILLHLASNEKLRFAD